MQRKKREKQWSEDEMERAGEGREVEEVERTEVEVERREGRKRKERIEG